MCIFQNIPQKDNFNIFGMEQILSTEHGITKKKFKLSNLYKLQFKLCDLHKPPYCNNSTGTDMREKKKKKEEEENPQLGLNPCCRIIDYEEKKRSACLMGEDMKKQMLKIFRFINAESQIISSPLLIAHILKKILKNGEK